MIFGCCNFDFKIILEPSDRKEKHSPVMSQAEIVSISQMDCFFGIPLNSVTSKQPEPCSIDQNIASHTNPQLDLDENVPVNSTGKF